VVQILKDILSKEIGSDGADLQSVCIFMLSSFFIIQYPSFLWHGIQFYRYRLCEKISASLGFYLRVGGIEDATANTILTSCAQIVFFVLKK
jgi:hypothetical protein